LTLPCQKAWLFARPKDSIEWLLSENVRFVAESVSPSITATFTVHPDGFLNELRAAIRLSADLREKHFDEFVAIHVPWWVAMASFLAGIKKRTGVASQWFSWIFFNKRLRQKRSQAQKMKRTIISILSILHWIEGLTTYLFHPDISKLTRILK